jgi:hypothetical protein
LSFQSSLRSTILNVRSMQWGWHLYFEQLFGFGPGCFIS